MTQRERIEQLERELAELRAQLARLQPVPGQPAAGEEWSITVGGERVQLRALTPAQWAVALRDLPSFLFAYAANAQTGAADQEVLERLTATAQQWILACALDAGNIRMERLTIPEAVEALKTISRLNGVDAQLGEMLQKKLQPSTRSTKPPGATA